MVTWILDVDSTKQRVNKYTVQNQNISIKFFWIYFENFSLSAGFKNLKKPNNHICLLFFLFLFCNAVLVGVVAGFDCTRMINLSNLLLHVPWETFLWRFLSRGRKEIKDFVDQRSKLHRNPWFNHTQNSFFPEIRKQLWKSSVSDCSHAFDNLFYSARSAQMLHEVGNSTFSWDNSDVWWPQT